MKASGQRPTSRQPVSGQRPAFVWTDLRGGVHYHKRISCLFVSDQYSRITLAEAQERKLREHSCDRVRRGTLSR
jgi:hypothetical protein